MLASLELMALDQRSEFNDQTNGVSTSSNSRDLCATRSKD